MRRILVRRSWLGSLAGLFLCVVSSLPAIAGIAERDFAGRVQRVLIRIPLTGGHDDLPWQIGERFKAELYALDLRADTSNLAAPGATALMSDIPRLRAGEIGQLAGEALLSVMTATESVSAKLRQVRAASTANRAELDGARPSAKTSPET